MRIFFIWQGKTICFFLAFLFLIFVSAEAKIKNKPLLKSYFYYLNLGAFCLAVGCALGERRIGKLPTNVFPAR